MSLCLLSVISLSEYQVQGKDIRAVVFVDGGKQTPNWGKSMVLVYCMMYFQVCCNIKTLWNILIKVTSEIFYPNPMEKG